MQHFFFLRIFSSFLIAGMILATPIQAFAIVFQFDRGTPGVKEFVESYVQFSVQGKPLSSVLPPVFYLVTPKSERETVIAAKVKNLQKNKELTVFLSDVVGMTPQQVKGPKGNTIFFHPAPTNTKVSAYLKWGEWLFLSGNPNALADFLKSVRVPEEAVTPSPAFSLDGLAKSAGVRFWADNANGEFTALIRENQQRSLIPMVKDPSQIKRFSGIFRLGPQQKIAAQAIAIPFKSEHRIPLKKELELTLESSRRLLEIFKVPSVGSVQEKGKSLSIRMTIDDYQFGQPGLFKRSAESPLKRTL
jgi:hypothetical protein